MKTTNAQNISALTGLRFLAALFVVISHASIDILKFTTHAPWLSFFYSLAAFGMPLFFILSGFVIFYNYYQLLEKPNLHNVSHFLIFRIARLYPLYIFVLVAEKCFSLIHYGGLSFFSTNSLQHIWLLLKPVIPGFSTMTITWFYKMMPGSTLTVVYSAGVCSQVAWSISTEFAFYLLFPSFCWLILKIRNSSSAVKYIIYLFLTLLFVDLLILFNTQLIDTWAVGVFGDAASIKQGTQDSFLRWLTYFTPLSQIVNFIIGACVARLYIINLKNAPDEKEKRRANFIFWIAIITLGVFFYYSFVNQFNHYFSALHTNCTFTLPIAALIALYSRYKLPFLNILKSKLFIWCGEASYSIYLLHMLTIHTMLEYYYKIEPVPLTSENIMKRLILLVLFITATIIISRITYLLIENPGKNFLRRVLQPRLHSREAVLSS